MQPTEYIYLGEPAFLDMSVAQGSDDSCTITFADSSGNPIDLSSLGLTFVFRVIPNAVSTRSGPVLEITLTNVDLPAGQIGLTITALDTSGLVARGYDSDIRSYDTSTPPQIRTWVRGTFTVASTTNILTASA
jgi:hypothetical protein